MKYILALFAITSFFNSNYSNAQTSQVEISGESAAKVMSALYDLGVRQSGIEISAMPMQREREDGSSFYDLSVDFGYPLGASNLSAKNVTLYESTTSAVLVMTYDAGIEQNSIVTKTSIIKVNNDSARIIANWVKLNGIAKSEDSEYFKLKATAYSVKNISCSRVVYPGAEASCQIDVN